MFVSCLYHQLLSSWYHQFPLVVVMCGIFGLYRDTIVLFSLVNAVRVSITMVHHYNIPYKWSRQRNI